MADLREFGESQTRIYQKRYFLAALAPLLILLPKLNSTLPGQRHAAREVAGYFQTLAFIQTGLESFFYLTPEENLSALHLHSLLSTPFVAVGYTEGGRFVSWIAAAASIILIILLANELFNKQIAILSPFLLMIHPLFAASSFAYQTEALSISLTTGALYCCLKFVKSDDQFWAVSSAIVLILSITVHLWEAVITLPIIVLLLVDRDYIYAFIFGIISVTTVTIVSRITELQSMGSSDLSGYSTISGGDWELLLQVDWWFRYLPSSESLIGMISNPFPVLLGITLPLTGGFIILFSYYFSKNQHKTSYIILVSWLCAGISIPLLLSRGFLGHEYYLWATLAPLAISGAIILSKTIEFICDNIDGASKQNMIRLMFVVLLITTSFLSIVRLPGNFPDVEVNNEVEPAKEVGYELRQYNINDSSEITFVGNHTRNDVYRDTFVSRAMIYSGLLIRERSHSENTQYGPDIAHNISEVDDCNVVVYIDNSTVKKC